MNFYPFSRNSWLRRLVLLGCISALAGCGGGGSDRDNPSNPVILKANVTGMTESGVLILRNGSNIDDLIITENGIHNFRIPLHPNERYNVTVIAEPIGQICSVNNGQGEIVIDGPAPVVNINCNTQSYTVGGTISGLQPGRQMMLLNNGADLSSISGHADGSLVYYSFKDPVATGSSYTVTVAANPYDQVCTVATAGSFTGISFEHTSFNSVNFMCDSLLNAHTIGGTVTGLAKGAQIVLQNNGGDSKTITANGSFSFATEVANNSSYDVRILAQSTNQVCTIQNGVGDAVQGDVNNVAVTCYGGGLQTFTISGSVKDWNGSKMLLKNSKINTYATVGTDGTFSFPPVVYGTPFNIIVSTFPVLQDCTVTNSTGAVEEDLTLAVSCATAPVETLYSFSANSDLAGYPVGLMQNNTGDLVGITTVRVVESSRDDRQYNTGNIFKMTPQGRKTTLHTFQGSNPNGVVVYDPSFPTGLMQGRDKNIYVTTYLGGLGPNQPGTFPAPSTNVGEIYKLTASPFPTVSSLYAFSCGTNPVLDQCTANVAPIAELTQGTDDYFYGVAYGYALRVFPENSGMIYKLSSGGAFAPLHNFTIAKGADGLHPNSKLTLFNGFLYGTTEKGGLYGKGTIFRVGQTGANFKTIYDFADGDFERPGIGVSNDTYPDGVYSDPYVNSYSGLVVGMDGNLYGVAKYGGDNKAGWIFKVTLTSTPIKVERLYSFAKGNNPTTELIQLSDGNFYGTTEKGGAHSMGSIFRITPKGVLTTLHDFAGIINEGDGNTPSTRLVAGSDGNLYGGTRSGGDFDLGTIYKMGRN